MAGYAVESGSPNGIRHVPGSGAMPGRSTTRPHYRRPPCRRRGVCGFVAERGRGHRDRRTQMIQQLPSSEDRDPHRLRGGFSGCSREARVRIRDSRAVKQRCWLRLAQASEWPAGAAARSTCPAPGGRFRASRPLLARNGVMPPRSTPSPPEWKATNCRASLICPRTESYPAATAAEELANRIDDFTQGKMRIAIAQPCEQHGGSPQILNVYQPVDIDPHLAGQPGKFDGHPPKQDATDSRVQGKLE